MNVTMASEQAAPTGAAAPAARIVNGVKVYGAGVTAVRALDGVGVGGFRRRAVHRGHGAVRLGEVDHAALPGRA